MLYTGSFGRYSVSISSSRVTLQGTGYRGKEEGVYRNMLGSAKNVVVKYFSFLYRYIFSYAQVCCVGLSLLAVVAGPRPRILGLMSGTADL